MSALDSFSDATREWFAAAFAAPTPAQAGAWDAIASGRHALVVAPTGSGKTLAAFLSAIDRQLTRPDRDAGTRILYVSPLKALAVDVERNLRTPLTGIRQTAARHGVTLPDVMVGLRTGDSTAAERRRLLSAPPEILITTPESLFLMLTSRARETLRDVETVIIDEVHAVAGTKRGAHLGLTLERLDALLPRPAQRLGLSATVAPLEEVARFVGGQAPVEIVAPPGDKRWDLSIVVPVADMTSPSGPEEDVDDEEGERSLWPYVESRVLDLIEAHDTTIVFVNSRRLAERLTARLNEVAAERAGDAEDDAGRTERPAQVMGGSGVSDGAAPVVAKAHHGSVSKDQRALIEDDLKAGRLPCVVATSSLELGIDMGSVDLVVQIESPPSVASALQRVGRAGHQVGEVSRGVVFPKHRGDLAPVAVTVERMRQGRIEQLSVPANPLDVLAQQLVAMTALDEWTADDLYALTCRAASYTRLSRPVFDATLDLLAGRYPSDEFAELRPRVVWDRVTGTVSGRPGSQRLAVTSGGTIPDRGLFGVFLVGGEGPGRRVGELDEEMVYESRVGDIFALGATSWRIEDITHDRVLVSPAPGIPGRLPFWRGDSLGRPADLGASVGSLVGEIAGMTDDEARARAVACGLDEWAADNLIRYVREQADATRVVPHDRQLVVERFRDDLGDWRLVLHSPYGMAVHAPWSLGINARLRERYGVDGQSVASDDGIVVRVPDTDQEPPDGSLVVFDPDELSELVTREVSGSALFASRFRECAARALLLPRRDPGRRAPLWQQRQRAASLLEVAAQYPSFPIILETVRECLQDVYDLPSLTSLMRRVESREVRVLDVATQTPSPFARTLLFEYVAQFVYEGDSPIAERRAAALSLDQGLLVELLGRTELRELLDPDVLAETEAALQHLAEERRARHAEDLVDLIRRIGPLSGAELTARVTDPDALPEWLETLRTSRRIVSMRVAGEDRWAVVEDVARLRDGLGAAVPPGVPSAFTEPVEDPIGDLVARYARSHGPFTDADVAARLGLGVAVVRQTLQRLGAHGRVIEGEFRPAGAGPEWCEAEVLRTLRRRSLAKVRREAEPVPPDALGRFLPAWQQVLGATSGSGYRGPDAVLAAVEQLAGVPVPASALETLVLPSRVRDYQPADLDTLMATGEVLWIGQGATGSGDGWVSLHLADRAPWSLPVPEDVDLGAIHKQLLERLQPGGAWFFRSLAGGIEGGETAIAEALWDLVWAGLVTNDTLAPLRQRLSGGRTRHRSKPRPGRARLTSGLTRDIRSDPAPGRWSLLPESADDPTRRATALSEQLLDRHGVVTRGAVQSEQVPGGFASVYRVLRTFEDHGRCRRGYFVESLGAAQFASPGAVDRLRTFADRADSPSDAPVVALAATDPASPYGAALPWPPREGHRPGRKAGAVVVLVDGRLVLYVERGGRTVLTYDDDPEVLTPAAAALVEVVKRGGLGSFTVTKADGADLLGSDAPLRQAFDSAGFVVTPRGLRLRA